MIKLVLSNLVIGVWWGWTILVDFFVVPSVFQIIPDFFLAGELGIKLFTKLNSLEILLSPLLLFLVLPLRKNHKTGKALFLLSLCLLFIILFYYFYLTPKINELSQMWKEADLKNLISSGQIPDIQQEHQKFHRLYVGLDSLKLLLLSVAPWLIYKTQAPLNEKA